MERARDRAWWYIPNDYKKALNALEDKLNDLVYTKSGLFRFEAVKLLQSTLSVKDSKMQRIFLTCLFVSIKSLMMY